MALIRPGTVLFAAVISAPALWQAEVAGNLDATVAMERFLLALGVSIVLLALLRAITAPYARRRIAEAKVRAEDKAVDDGPPPPG